MLLVLILVGTALKAHHYDKQFFSVHLFYFDIHHEQNPYRHGIPHHFSKAVQDDCKGVEYNLVWYRLVINV